MVVKADGMLKRMLFALVAFSGLMAVAAIPKPPAVEPFTTGTDFLKLTNGVLDVNCDDLGEPSVTNVYWSAKTSDAGVVITNKCLTIDTATPFDRLILPRLPKDDAAAAGKYAASNVYVRTSAFTNLYADTWVRFSPCVNQPQIDTTDRIVVWLRENRVDGLDTTITNLIVTAGRWDDNYGSLHQSRDYVLTNAVAVDEWCHLTVYAIADATAANKMAAGFALIINDCPAAVVEGGYDIGAASRDAWLTPESRILKSERRLFPSLASPNHDNAYTLSRMTFSGEGAVSNICFTSDNDDLPVPMVHGNIFTLKWDAGVKQFDCIVSNGAAVVTNKAVNAALRIKDFDLGADHYAVITVTNLLLNGEFGYSNSTWKASGDCVVDGNVFTYDGECQNPIGNIITTRNQVSVGDGTCTTFKEAIEKAIDEGKDLITLATNVVVQNQINGDHGQIVIGSGTNLVLDLAGFTLQGSKGATILVSGGRLRIIDSSAGQTGRVLPCDKGTVAVKCGKSLRSGAVADPPELIIDGGWYDGTVEVADDLENVGSCIIDGGCFTNRSDTVGNFYLEQYVTNTSTYFARRDEYWQPITNGFIWCGKGGDDTRWNTTKNWRGGAVPEEDDLAIFPYTNSAWTVDFETGVSVTNFWMDGDIEMCGTNDFSHVKIVGDGRFAGDGQIVFSGVMPGNLTADDVESGEVRLDSGWTGCVKLCDLNKPARTMNNLQYWGTKLSSVEFNGVRGYVSDKLNHSQPYKLVLTDDITDSGATTNVAWRNETGYTGSVVSFRELAGSGTFSSPKNLKTVNQVIQFTTVSNYAGRLEVGGKRVLLGTGPITTAISAGSIAFTSNVTVRSAAGWNATHCSFMRCGGAPCVINVIGNTNDVLMTCSSADTVDDAQAAFAGIADNYYVVNQKGSIVFSAVKPGMMKKLSALGVCDVIAAADVSSQVKAGNKLEIPFGSTVSIVGNNVLVDGKVVSTVAEYYALVPADGDDSTYSVELDSAVVMPTLADFEIVDSDGDGKVVISVSNTTKGLYYAVQTNTSLKDDGWTTLDWQQCTDDSKQITLEADAHGGSLFYRVIVSDVGLND